MKITTNQAIGILNILRAIPTTKCSGDTILAIAKIMNKLEEIEKPAMAARNQIFKNAGAPPDGTPELAGFIASEAGKASIEELTKMLDAETEEINIKPLKFGMLKVGNGEKENQITPQQISILMPILAEED